MTDQPNARVCVMLLFAAALHCNITMETGRPFCGGMGTIGGFSLPDVKAAAGLPLGD